MMDSFDMIYCPTNDNQLSPLPDLSDFALPPFIPVEDFPTFDAWGDDNNHSNTLADNSIPDISDGNEGFVELQPPPFDSVYELVRLSKDNSANDSPQSTGKNSNKAFIAKLPDVNEKTILTNGAQFIETNQSLVNRDVQENCDGISGFDEAQTQLFDGISVDLADDSTVMPEKNSSTKKNSFVVKSSDTNDTTNFINGVVYIQTGQSLVLTIPPFLYQHVRYENELEKTLRYITVLNDDAITLKMPDVFTPGVSLWMRITRTTIPYRDNNLIFRHPYPIWLNDEHVKARNGSLFIRITEQVIKIDKLGIQRLKQDPFREIQQLAIYKSTELDFTDFYSINPNTPKDTISKYQLKYFTLHFQVFLVDENNKAYPTDLQCQTEPIYEYDPKELKILPSIVGNVQRNSVKRKQIGQRKESKVLNKKKNDSKA